MESARRNCFMCRKENGFGFVLCCENDTTDTYILQVLEESSASESGLMSGDKIIKINGINVEHENHADVVQRLQGLSTLDLEVEHDKEAREFFTKPKNGMTVLPLEEKPKHPIPKIISVKREERGYRFIIETIGKTRRTGDAYFRHNPKGTKAHYIQDIDEASAAYEAGLRINDKVIEINGVNVERESHAYVIHAIRHSPGNKLELFVVDRDAEEYYMSLGTPPLRCEAIRNNQMPLDEKRIIDCSYYAKHHDNNNTLHHHHHHHHQATPPAYAKIEKHTKQRTPPLRRHSSDASTMELLKEIEKLKQEVKEIKMSTRSLNDPNQANLSRKDSSSSSSAGDFNMDLQTLKNRVRLNATPKSTNSRELGYKYAHRDLNGRR